MLAGGARWLSTRRSHGLLTAHGSTRQRAGRCCTINDSNPNRDADARLIVAAPKMLAALEMMLSWHDCDGWCIEAHDAIAEAKGEAQSGH